MSLSSKMSKWMVSTVTYKTVASVDSVGDPTFSAASTMDARVENRQVHIKARDGNTYESRHQVASLTQIPLKSRVWLPGDNTGDDNAARQPLDIPDADTKLGTDTLYMTFF